MSEKLTITPETTLGPFYPETFVPRDANDLTRIRFGQPQAEGEKIKLRGTVWDANNVGRPRILLEIWQANAAGAYRHPNELAKDNLDPNFDGWGRTLSADDGTFEFLTIMPGAAEEYAPHIKVSLLGTGIDRLQTAIYFPGSPGLETDPVLKSLGDRAHLLLAREEGVVNGTRSFRFDLQMRGRNETPFFLD